VDPIEVIDQITSRNDLAHYLRTLAERARTEPNRFENQTLSAYLDAAGAWLEDAEGFYLNRGEPVPETPTWSFLAAVFAAAAIYE